MNSVRPHSDGHPSRPLSRSDAPRGPGKIGRPAGGRGDMTGLRGGTHGQQSRLSESAGFIASVTVHAPGLQLEKHSHERASINLVLRGHYAESFNGSSDAYSPLSLIVKPAGESHANSFREEGAKCLLLEFSQERARSVSAFSDVLTAPAVDRSGAAVPAGLRIVRELESPDSFSPLAVESAALDLLIAVSRRGLKRPGAEPGWMRQVLEMLHALPAEKLSLTRIASAVGVHPVHLARSFRRMHGMSIGTYARRLKVEKAVDMIGRTGLPLADIAFALGFCDQSHMSRLVKRVARLTPREIRLAVEAKCVPEEISVLSIRT